MYTHSQITAIAAIAADILGLSSFVVSADSANCFKNRLDNFWKNQDIIYDYQADIHGTGNRNEVVFR